jgi:hypothetical protein
LAIQRCINGCHADEKQTAHDFGSYQEWIVRNWHGRLAIEDNGGSSDKADVNAQVEKKKVLHSTVKQRLR